MNDENNIISEETPDEKTFTQSELNRIVSERVAKEKAKYELELGKRDKELKRRERAAGISVKLTARGLVADEVAEIWADLPDDVVEKNIELMDRAVRESVQRGIDERLRGGAHKAGAPDTGDGIRKAMGLR